MQNNLSSNYVLSGDDEVELTELQLVSVVSTLANNNRFILFSLTADNNTSGNIQLSLRLTRDAVTIGTHTITVEPGTSTIQLPVLEQALPLGSYTYEAFVTQNTSAPTPITTATYLAVFSQDVEVTAGATEFTDLSDVPSSFTGHAGKFVNVNAGATALEFDALVAGDIPALDASKITTGNFPVARLNSGTGATASTFWRGDATWAVAGTGDVVGPSSATDEALARFDSTTGKLIQNSVGLLSDAGALTGITVNANVITAGTVATARLGSGTADGTTFLRGDQTWQAVASTPGGATTNVQFNNSGAFDGDAEFTWDTTNKRLNLTSGTTAADDTAWMLGVAGTLPTAPSVPVSGVLVNVTSAGSATTSGIEQQALEVQLNAGYTGSRTTRGLITTNTALGTAATLAIGGTGTDQANFGVSGRCTGAGTGINIGTSGIAAGSTDQNIGVYGRSNNTAAGGSFGVLGTAAGSTEATGLKNVAVYGTLETSFVALNANFAGLFDGGFLIGDLDRSLYVKGTLPSAPATGVTGSEITITSFGSASQEQRALDVALNAGYTGSARTRGLFVANAVVGTGATLNLGTGTSPVGNLGVFGRATGAGAGINIGTYGLASGSTSENIGLFGQCGDTAAGSNIAVLGTASGSTEGTGLVNVGVLGTTDSALPAANVSAGVLAAAQAGGFPLRAYYDDTEVLRIDDSATATHTYLMIYDVDNAALERVTVGAPDSGGTGFKVLCIPN